MGIYGNSKLEEMYPVYIEDATKAKLDGARQYTVGLRWAITARQAFWSLTIMSRESGSCQSIHRYRITRRCSAAQARSDGGLTLLIQNGSPGKDRARPTGSRTEGPFVMYLRLYWPKDEAVEEQVTAPPVKRM